MVQGHCERSMSCQVVSSTSFLESSSSPKTVSEVSDESVVGDDWGRRRKLYTSTTSSRGIAVDEAQQRWSWSFANDREEVGGRVLTPYTVDTASALGEDWMLQTAMCLGDDQRYQVRCILNERESSWPVRSVQPSVISQWRPHRLGCAAGRRLRGWSWWWILQSVLGRYLGACKKPGSRAWGGVEIWTRPQTV